MWLPREAVHVSLQFLLNDVPEVPSGVIWKFLRDINRVRLSCHFCPNFLHMKIVRFESLKTLLSSLCFVCNAMSRGWHNEGVAEAREPKSSKCEINVRVSHQCSP
jgi:hypothetical protein